MLWVWTDELMQHLEVDERRGWVPLIGYRISPDEDLDRLARAVAVPDGAVDSTGDASA